MEIVLYTDQITTRLNYVLDFISEGQVISFQPTNDLQLFEAANQPKLVYSDRYFDAGYAQISPADVLFQEGIQPVAVKWENDTLLVDGKTDLLAAIFYVLTNYSDYLVKEEYKDKHGRVPAKFNVLLQGGQHHKLMVERWSKQFLEYLQKVLSVDFTIEKQPFLFTPTFDIDIAYAFREKEKWRALLSKTKDIVTFNKERLRERAAVLAEKSADPYDTYSQISSLKEQGIQPCVFWLLGDYTNYDRNIDFENPVQQALINSLCSVAKIGIHPSYKSNEVLGQLEKEINRLTKITGDKVRHSRQHYLKVSLPKTYKWLMKVGVAHDYTLGFAETHGFKVGTVRPHKWFNLENDQVTNLTLHPFAYMDGSLLEYQHLSTKQAEITIKTLFDEVAAFGGEFSFIWHNSTISDYGKWKGWKAVFEHTINLFLQHQDHAKNRG
jgi:hypothetical protein